MKLRTLLCAALAASLPALPAAAASKSAKADIPKLEITIVPGALRYAITRFDAAAGTPLALTLKNTCIMPHNLVLVAPGKGDAVFEQAMALTDGLAKNYVPDAATVLAATKLVNPGQSEAIRFTVPAQPGEYPYLCTFPGHGAVMRGVMRVRPAGEKLEPPVVETFATPKLADALRDSGATSTPMGTRQRPFVLRSFVPNPCLDEAVFAHHDRGLTATVYDPSKGVDVEGQTVPPSPGVPAGIAVSFGKDFAYVWDSTECQLLYAWTNGFLNMTPYWGVGAGGARTKMAYVPLIEGTLVFKTAGSLPLQPGDQPVTPRFRGYRLLSGNPEFSYDLGATRVREHVMPANPGTFMVHYHLENPPAQVRLAFAPSVRPQVSCDAGRWNGNTLEIAPEHRTHFMLLVKFQPGETFKPVDPATFSKRKTSEAP